MVIRWVNESMASKGLTVRAMNSGNPNVPLTKYGDDYLINLSSAGAPRYLTITFNGFTGDLCSVTVTKEATFPAPLPTVVAVMKTSTGKHVPEMLSHDIWVDSSKDGYSPAAAASHASDGGDQPWAGHQNRIYFRVHNIGAADATNVRVRLTASSVLSVPGCAGVTGGTVWERTIPVVKARSEEIGFVPWRPADSAPQQIRLQLSPVQGQPSAGAPSTAASTTSVVTSPVAGGAVDVPVTIGGFADCGSLGSARRPSMSPAGGTCRYNPRSCSRATNPNTSTSG